MDLSSSHMFWLSFGIFKIFELIWDAYISFCIFKVCKTIVVVCICNGQLKIWKAQLLLNSSVVTDVFRKKLNYEPRKLAKTVRIFMEIEHVKDWGVTFWPKRIWRIFPTLWSGHEIWPNLWPNSWPLHSVGNSRPILLHQNVTSRFLMCSISTNILTVLANFLAIIIQFFQKTSVMTMVTLLNRVPSS